MQQVVVDAADLRCEGGVMDLGDPITVGVLTPHTTPGADVEFPDMAPGRTAPGPAR